MMSDQPDNGTRRPDLNPDKIVKARIGISYGSWLFSPGPRVSSLGSPGCGRDGGKWLV